MASDGRHGWLDVREVTGGGPSDWDRRMMALRRQSLEEWRRLHAESVARIQAFQSSLDPRKLFP